MTTKQEVLDLLDSVELSQADLDELWQILNEGNPELKND